MFEAALTNEFQGRVFRIEVSEGVYENVSPLDIFSNFFGFLVFIRVFSEFELGIPKCFGILIALFVGFSALGLIFLKLLVKKMQWLTKVNNFEKS